MSILKNGFSPPKTFRYAMSRWKKALLSTLNVMILQIIKNECVKSSGDINIQISYKILLLEVLRKVPILHSPPYFKEELCPKTILDSRRPWVFKG
jgi:hypothetical protein